MGAKDDTRLADLAARQRGLVTSAQFRALGVSDRRVDGLVERGHLHRIHRGVYAVGHPAITPLARQLAATMALDGVASHRSAAWLWELLPLPPGSDVTVATLAGRGPRDGIVVHRSLLRPEEVTVVQGVPCTTLVRTLLDLAAVLDDRTLLAAFEEAQFRHKLRPAAVGAELAARGGRRGVNRLRVIVDGAVEPGAIESVLELRFKKLCRDFGLPEPLCQVWFGPFRADFWFAEQRVVVEVDGGRHRLPSRRAADARKAAYLESVGQTVVRATYAEVTDERDAVATRVASALYSNPRQTQ